MGGHDGSEAPEGAYTLELLTEDAIALLDALGIDTVHFVGLSIGGMIAQGLALNHGDKLKRYRDDILEGIEHAPGSIAGLYRSENFGKRLIRIAPQE